MTACGAPRCVLLRCWHESWLRTQATGPAGYCALSLHFMLYSIKHPLDSPICTNTIVETKSASPRQRQYPLPHPWPRLSYSQPSQASSGLTRATMQACSIAAAARSSLTMKKKAQSCIRPDSTRAAVPSTSTRPWRSTSGSVKSVTRRTPSPSLMIIMMILASSRTTATPTRLTRARLSLCPQTPYGH